MKQIGILCAGDTELAPFLEHMKGQQITEKAMLKFHTGTINHVNVSAVYSGVCKVNAAIAAQLGVDDFRAGVLPADKAEYVAALRKEGHTVLMVGDGINDSPALSEADAGIAISDGAAIAREIADITIAADSLWELVRLRQLAMALMRRIRNNYRFVIGFNGALIGLGVTGILPPTTSAMLHNLSTLGVSLHSMTALPQKKQD